MIWCCIATAGKSEKQTKVVQTREVVPAQRVVQREVVYVQEPQVIYEPAPSVVYQAGADLSGRERPSLTTPS